MHIGSQYKHAAAAAAAAVDNSLLMLAAHSVYNGRDMAQQMRIQPIMKKTSPQL